MSELTSCLIIFTLRHFNIFSHNSEELFILFVLFDIDKIQFLSFSEMGFRTIDQEHALRQTGSL